jgi:hypothetical protein
MLRKRRKKPCFMSHHPSQEKRRIEAQQQETLRHTLRGKPPMLWEKML